jgi:hypothetical protein
LVEGSQSVDHETLGTVSIMSLTCYSPTALRGRDRTRRRSVPLRIGVSPCR